MGQDAVNEAILITAIAGGLALGITIFGMIVFFRWGRRDGERRRRMLEQDEDPP